MKAKIAIIITILIFGLGFGCKTYNTNPPIKRIIYSDTQTMSDVMDELESDCEDPIKRYIAIGKTVRETWTFVCDGNITEVILKNGIITSILPKWKEGE